MLLKKAKWVGLLFFFQLRRKFKSKHFHRLLLTVGYMWRTHAKTFKLNNNLNRVCHIYLVSNL